VARPALTTADFNRVKFDPADTWAVMVPGVVVGVVESFLQETIVTLNNNTTKNNPGDLNKNKCFMIFCFDG
jgi:hypothetical protein